MKIIFLFFAWIIIFTPVRSEAEPYIFSTADSLNTSDSTLAEYYKTNGDSLRIYPQFDSAIVYYEKGAELYERMKDWDNYIYCLTNKAFCYSQTGKFSKSIELYNATKSLILEKLDEKHINMLNVLFGLGYAYWKSGDYKNSEQYSLEAVSLAEELEKDADIQSIESIADVYHGAAIIYYELGRYDEAINHIKKAINIHEKNTSKNLHIIAVMFNTLGVIYSQTGYFDEAMVNYEKVLENLSGTGKKVLIASTYNNMAISISERYSDYDEALLYQERALSLFLDLFGEANDYTGLAYYNKGEFLFKKGLPDKALIFYNKALNSYLSVFNSEEHTDVAMTYNSIGEVYERLADYDKAYEYYNKALSIRLNIFGEQHLNIAKGYNNLGTLNRIQKKYDQAVKYHEDALAVQKQIFGDNHPEIADSYNLLGMVYREMGEYDISLQLFQKAIIANVPSFSNKDLKINPEPEGILSEPRLLESLGYKAETLALWHEEKQDDLALLETAFNTYKSQIELIDRMRSGYKAEGSKLFLAEKSSGIFEKAIKVSIQLNKLTGEDYYKNEAYAFCEKSKARILQEAINESRARNFSGIPDSLIEKERHFKTDLTFYENQLQEEKFKREDIDSVKIREFESRLFSLNRDYQQLVENLEQNYPKYYSSKYFDRPVKINDVQNSLTENEALLEYFAGSEAIYLYYFTQNEYDLFTINIDADFNHVVNNFYSSINTIDKKEYLSSANQLYSLLIKPVENLLADKQKLTIIPDGQLYYIPFEALVTEDNDHNTRDFSNQNYLINNYDIAYHYSTSFLIDSQNYLLNDNNNDGLIGFAPVFKDSPKAELYVAASVRSVYSTNNGTHEYRFLNDNDEILELPYSEEEAKYILNLFNDSNIPADGYLFDFATKDNFKAEAGKYKYIHLATHSFVNPEKPQHSGIILAQPEDTLSSGGTLYSNEIYNLDLNADLVVLSSCESGIGKLVKGEGVMALTRGFLYAGANNIITSLWKVYDKSTAELMKSFYTNVLENKSYSEALRKAKLEMIRNKGTSFPINWSGFVLIGR